MQHIAPHKKGDFSVHHANNAIRNAEFYINIPCAGQLHKILCLRASRSINCAAGHRKREFNYARSVLKNRFAVSSSKAPTNFKSANIHPANSMPSASPKSNFPSKPPSEMLCTTMEHPLSRLIVAASSAYLICEGATVIPSSNHSLKSPSSSSRTTVSFPPPAPKA